jgi:GcrA cell cycle regulator
MLDDTSATTIDTPQRSKWAFGQKWTDVDIERVRGYWAAGKSKRWIGIEMGKSRGAISGLVNRHHMESPNSMSNRQKDPPSRTKARRMSGGARRAAAKAKSRVNGLAADSVVANVIRERPELPAPSEVAVKAFGVPCGLLALEHGQCKWITNDPRSAEGAMFCNAQAGAGEPWCSDHGRVAYNPGAYRWAR